MVLVLLHRLSVVQYKLRYGKLFWDWRNFPTCVLDSIFGRVYIFNIYDSMLLTRDITNIIGPPVHTSMHGPYPPVDVDFYVKQTLLTYLNITFTDSYRTNSDIQILSLSYIYIYIYIYTGCSKNKYFLHVINVSSA